jgi:dimethylamine monooxygenase subunit A
LNMGMSGQDTPGILRAGLRRLKNGKYFLVEEPHRMKYELLLKKKALDDPQRFSHVFVAQPESLEAQRECLDMFLEYLPRRYPDLYVYDKELNTIHVTCIDTTFQINEYYNTRPLELCERIVQEDLCLMSPPKSREAEMAVTESYRMAAAAVVFSFEDLPQKLGQPMEFLHAPVPGYEKHIRKSMNLTFSKLKSEQPVWRNNWGIGPSGEMDKPLYGSETSLEQRKMTMVTEDMVKAKFLKVEYETIRRLPKTRYILFTIKSMCDPLYELEKLPMASACLAASIRGMSTDMRKYKGIDNDETCEAILQYLDKIVKENGSIP